MPDALMTALKQALLPRDRIISQECQTLGLTTQHIVRRQYHSLFHHPKMSSFVVIFIRKYIVVWKFI